MPNGHEKTPEKEALLKPQMLACAQRLLQLVQIDAPGVLVGEAAFYAFTTALAVYGERAGWGLINALRTENLHSRGVCTVDDCVHTIERPLPFCLLCRAKILEEAEQAKNA